MKLFTTARFALVCAVLVLLLGGCSHHQVDAKFGDQNFKSAIALVELYKVRHGTYPASLDDLDYLGQWDPIYIRGVKYRRVGNGYEMDIEHGWVGKPTLSYPPGFWRGLGLVATNVGGFPGVARNQGRHVQLSDNGENRPVQSRED